MCMDSLAATPANSPRCFFADAIMSSTTGGCNGCDGSSLSSVMTGLRRAFSASRENGLTIRTRRAVLSSSTCFFISRLGVKLISGSGMSKLATRPYSCCRVATSLRIGWSKVVIRT